MGCQAREAGLPLADDYTAALLTLGEAFDHYTTATGLTAVLVGGAATAIYTDGAFPSGDFDVAAADDAAFDAAMRSRGFVRENRAGRLRIGYYHPAHPAYGFQQVSGPLFDGQSDEGRLIRMKLDKGVIALPAIEDIIADRLARHAIASPSDDSRLRQARTLFVLADNLDLAYLHRRILEESGDPALLGLAGP